MRAEFINPFLHSIVDVLSTMARMDVTPGAPRLKNGNIAKGDVTGLIGLAGNRAKGSLAITFTEPVILEVTARMLGEEIFHINETVTDCVGEITNIVTGGAKRSLSENGYDFDLAIPGVVAGKDHIISHGPTGKTILMPFETASGEFFVEICFAEYTQ
ncbi:MAG: chemotaxis protein CheX [Candidatus Sedimenticola sp. 20ELBAFRAG]